MSSDFEEELVEDWDEAADQLETELCEEIQVSVADQMEFEEE